MFDAASSDSSEVGALALLLGDLAAEAPRVRLAAGQVLYGPEDDARKVFVVLEGQVRTHQVGRDGMQRLVEIMGPGDWCGTAAVARRSRYGERAESAAASLAASVPIERFLGELGGRPAAACELAVQLARRLVAFGEEAAQLAFDDCNTRLVHALQRLSRSPAATHDGPTVTLHITHQQLAAAVGAARETVSLALGDLRRRKLVRTGRRELVFDPRRLPVADAPTPQRVEPAQVAVA
jgi:CRP/FNR family transcriptional regulator